MSDATEVTATSPANKRVRGTVLVACLVLVLASIAGERSFRAVTEPIRSELGLATLTRVFGLGGDAGLANFSLEIDPKVLRAAQLLSPRPLDQGPIDPADRWWLPAHFRSGDDIYPVEVQIEEGPGLASLEARTWRIRFESRHTFDGMRALEIMPARPRTHIVEWLARRAAGDLHLLAAPAGFASLKVNGADIGLVFWSEGESKALLERLGFPPGEILQPRSAPTRGRKREGSGLAAYAPTFSGSADRVASRRLTTLVALSRYADDSLFEQELPSLLDIESFLRWDALARVFGHAGIASTNSVDWFFDPVSGLLEPIVTRLGTSSLRNERSSLDESDVALIGARILSRAAARARRDEILRELLDSDSNFLARADDQLGEILPTLALTRPWFARPALIHELALLRRETRQDLEANQRVLRALLGPVDETASAPLAAAPSRTPLDPDLVADMRRAGLRVRVAAGELIVPAGVHHLTRSFVIPASHRLRIQPGAEIELDPKVSLVSFRGLHAVGTPEQPIVIRAAVEGEAWGTIGVARAPERSELAFVRVSGGSHGQIDGIEFSGQLSFNASDVTLRDCEIREAKGDDALSIRRSSFRIVRSHFIDNRSDGFDSEWSRGAIEDSFFANNGDDGVDLASSEVSVDNTRFRGMGDKAISAGERSLLAVANSQLLESQIAIASKEDSRILVRSSEFRRNEIGISLYRDKPIFGSGYGIVNGGLFAENQLDFDVEAGSDLELHGVETNSGDGEFASRLAALPSDFTTLQ